MQQIKRATKGGGGGEQNSCSKDEVHILRQEIATLRQQLTTTTTEYDRKLAEISYDCNRRISSLTSEYDKLATLVQTSLRGPATAAPSGHVMLVPTSALTATQPQPLQMHVATGDLLQSLSQAAAASLRQESTAPSPSAQNGAGTADAAAAAAPENTSADVVSEESRKRPAETAPGRSSTRAQKKAC